MDGETRGAVAVCGDGSSAGGVDGTAADIAFLCGGAAGCDAAIDSADEATTTTDGLKDDAGTVVAGGGDAAGELGVIEVASRGVDAELLGAATDDVAADISDDAAASADGLEESTRAVGSEGGHFKGKGELEIGTSGFASGEAAELNGASGNAADPTATSTDGLVDDARRKETCGLQCAAPFYEGESAAGTGSAIAAAAEDDGAAGGGVTEADHAAAAADGLHEVEGE